MLHVCSSWTFPGEKQSQQNYVGVCLWIYCGSFHSANMWTGGTELVIVPTLVIVSTLLARDEEAK